MPRTRTKFIWPPSTSMVDADPTATIEPRAKRQRVTGPAATTDGRARSHDASISRVQEDKRTLQLQPTDSAFETSIGPASTSSPSYQGAVVALLRRYQEWRRNGSLHDDCCFVCHEPENLVPCETCRRSQHEGCMASGPDTFGQWIKNHWYCHVCVERNWHIDPPTMTPPASPTLSPQQPAQDASKPPPPAENIPASAYQHRTTQSDFTHNDQEALSILAEMSRSLSRGPPSKPAGAIVSAPISTSQHTAHPPLPTARATPIPRRETRAPPPPSSQSPSVPLVDSHARKSRFATLSSEIDSALWVLYRELESANSLRQQIAELEAQITKLRQDVSIRDNQLILSRRAAEAGRVPQAEIDKLRAEAARGESAVREAEALRARNEVLEKELREARAETESMSGTLNEWKGKLINLIGS